MGWQKCSGIKRSYLVIHIPDMEYPLHLLYV
ncbi:Uncharacterised protein [Shigella sonnei]|nr:Uncharacterised protein [Shigella sonnei]SIZ70364.1 Uncharacterised protein [Shigella sonnei]SIZ80152.1 Uncharacterised protein [Shigella sonnei]SJA14798.1 Uncharacterised protein [Shigella sonnei]SJC60669.1 Uncharacterised protein [Shigella sonnei]